MSAPTHYKRLDPEPIVVIERWGLPFHLANVVKYIARREYKGSEIADLRKARWCLDRYIALREHEVNGAAMPEPGEQAG